jgi:5'-phosphate synthase pdxT subunit
MTEGGEVLDGMVLPGGESTAMGLIGTHRTNGKTVWEAIREFIDVDKKPTWGTCAGMILLAERCVGASACIQEGQALIGGMDILVCRNYFGSQVSSFEMATPPPPSVIGNTTTNENIDESSYPGVFIRAPAILSAGSDVTVLGKVVATPCRQAAVVLQELERKIENGETVIQMGVVDAIVRNPSQDNKKNITYRAIIKPPQHKEGEEEKKESTETNNDGDMTIELPGAADGSNAREVICAVQRNNLLCTAFHPELTNDYRWHKYFASMVRESML